MISSFPDTFPFRRSNCFAEECFDLSVRQINPTDLVILPSNVCLCAWLCVCVPASLLFCVCLHLCVFLCVQARMHPLACQPVCLLLAVLKHTLWVTPWSIFCCGLGLLLLAVGPAGQDKLGGRHRDVLPNAAGGRQDSSG